MGPETAFDATTNVIKSGTQSIVVHCHFYNCALQAAIEASMGDDAPALLTEGARRVVRSQFEGLNVKADQAYATSAEVFRTLGFGTLDFANVERGEVVLRASHYALGWVASRGTRTQPVCYFAAGFIAATTEVARGHASGVVEVRESRCYVCGGDDCTFSVTSS